MKAPWSWLWFAGFVVTSVMLHLALNQRDGARQAIQQTAEQPASLVVVVILAPDRDALTIPRSRDYAPPVTVNPVAGFGDPSRSGATAPTQQQALFLCLPFGRAPVTRCLSMADRVGRPSGLPGSVSPVRQPCAVCHPIPFGDGRWQLSTQKRSSTPMANLTQVAPVDLVGEAYDATTLSAHVVADLGGLFRAIYTGQDDPPLMRRLAGIGQYLADDHAASLEHLASELSKQLDQRDGTSTTSGSAGRVSL